MTVNVFYTALNGNDEEQCIHTACFIILFCEQMVFYAFSLFYNMPFFGTRVLA